MSARWLVPSRRKMEIERQEPAHDLTVDQAKR